ncbi:threonine/serine exporter family protein [Gordonia spumicola]|uniref:threonine/serine exporter family protein n=1 Tax=Gordonia spumicola TaxID=589161 RepID=UPI001E3632A1|nr:threonine/serine exporter family protein [Gordonia spumicola]
MIESPARTRLLLGDLGALLLDAGLSVTEVHTRLSQIAASVKAPVTVSVLPKEVFVADAASGETTTVQAAGTELSMRQTAIANRLAERVRLGLDSFADLPELIGDVRRITRRRPDMQMVIGSALVAAGLAVLFRCPWWAVVTSTIAGLVVGVCVIVIRRVPTSVAILPFVVAFVSTSLVGTTAQVFGLGPVPLYAVCAPVAVLVPGALITNALLELTAADVVTGSSRLMYGVIMLGFMAAGISAGARLTDTRLDESSARKLTEAPGLTGHLGWQAHPPTWLSWVGVVFLAVGVGAAFGAGFRLSAVALAVMTGVYAVLTVLGPVIGDIQATGVIACIVFAASQAVERRTPAIPSVAFFFPAFLLLVPGTVGLVALAASDTNGIALAVGTFVSLCIGVKVGEFVSAIGLPSRSGEAP